MSSVVLDSCASVFAQCTDLTTHETSGQCGALPERVGSGSEGETTPLGSPFTPLLTQSITPGSSVNASPTLSPQLDIHEHDLSASYTTMPRVWDAASLQTLEYAGHSGSLELDINSILSKFYTESEDAGQTSHVPAAPAALPPVITIPAAKASDFSALEEPPKKRARKNNISRERKTKDKTQIHRPPVRFCFVSVQQDSQQVGENGVTFTESMEDALEPPSFEHGPSEFPPRPYPGGEYAVSPLRPEAHVGRVPASQLDYLPVLEARISRLEYSLKRYVEFRSDQALHRSILPERQISL